ncbi:MAG: hypothetical protein JF617_06385 [Burkholderiales bacterium]|nr:hypothetical protein [Burkholderiales bacterium]
MPDAIDRSAIFEEIWADNHWGSPESRSGPGSEVQRTAPFRAALEAFLVEIGARSLYDAPCGDYNWMRHVALPDGLAYVGADIVAPMIAELQSEYGSKRRRFIVADIVADPPPTADVWLCRESLFHLSIAESRAVIAHWRASAIPYFMATSTPTVTQNTDIQAGGWRPLNLELADFDLGPPMARIPDGSPRDLAKVIGIWTADR